MQSEVSTKVSLVFLTGEEPVNFVSTSGISKRTTDFLIYCVT
nr:MAG TPA: hypothetical protein [Caudoviricetes sp.]